ncbi:16S rRNA (guanine(527)-N(7))-methyltransferase RsmG [Roseiterribacter gracilis]|uniref:Ribosomal RNA small subunit methyltransferase G n=1 Tax=Roseiterribacter gracilis TaxID=2812848 RepID=A0A8S8XBB5_9PROT|nr:ribosomal RNA small subunit methyltransferase G [Rhodospirillales bacterium TMPK1]
MTIVASPDGQAAFAAATGVSRETLARLDAYRAMLLEANRGLALIGKNTEADIWDRHFLDSAQLLPLLPKPDARVVDVGTGAGFPGLVLAIVGGPRVELIENNIKKAEFLAAVIEKLQLDVVLHAKKVEAVRPFPADVATSRALGPLISLIQLTIPFLHHGGVGIFPKGRTVAAELEAARARYRFDAELIPSKTAEDARIVRLANLRRA